MSTRTICDLCGGLHAFNTTFARRYKRRTLKAWSPFSFKYEYVDAIIMCIDKLFKARINE